MSVNGVAIQVLLDLGRVTGDKRHTDAARRAALWAATQLLDAPEAMPSLLANWEELTFANVRVLQWVAFGGFSVVVFEKIF